MPCSCRIEVVFTSCGHHSGAIGTKIRELVFEFMQLDLYRFVKGLHALPFFSLVRENLIR